MKQLKQSLEEYFQSVKQNQEVEQVICRNEEDFETEMVIGRKSHVYFIIKPKAPFAIIRVLASNTSIDDSDELDHTLYALGEAFKEVIPSIIYSVIDETITFQLIISFDNLSETDALSLVKEQFNSLIEQITTHQDIFSAMDDIPVETRDNVSDDSKKSVKESQKDSQNQNDASKNVKSSNGDLKVHSQKSPAKHQTGEIAKVAAQKEKTAGAPTKHQQNQTIESTLSDALTTPFQKNIAAVAGEKTADKTVNHNVSKQQNPQHSPSKSAAETVSTSKTDNAPKSNDLLKQHPNFSLNVLEQMSQMYTEIENLYEQYRTALDEREKLLDERERQIQEQEQKFQQDNELKQREADIEKREKKLRVEQQKLQYEWHKLKMQQDIYQKKQSNASTKAQMSKK